MTGPPAAEGMSEERMQSLPLARAECVDGCVSVDGTKVGPSPVHAAAVFEHPSTI